MGGREERREKEWSKLKQMRESVVEWEGIDSGELIIAFRGEYIVAFFSNGILK